MSEGVLVTLDELQEAHWTLEWTGWDEVAVGRSRNDASGGEEPRLSRASGTASYVTTIQHRTVRLLRSVEAVSRGMETTEDLYDWMISSSREAGRARLQGATLVQSDGAPLPEEHVAADLDFITSGWQALEDVMPPPATQQVSVGSPSSGIIHSS